jgi:NAD(P)-dependent dehydrogenase (short-subunit alcohol dehydrogenase family)
MRLRGRVAVVTECGQGESFGVVWARALAGAGASVVVADRDAARAEAVAGELAATGAEAVATVLDVGSQASCDAVAALGLARFGRIDVLANTHHLWHDLRRDDASDTYLHDVLDYNAVSILRTTRAVLPVMRTQGGGRIVALSSIGAWQTGGRAAARLASTG